MNTSLDSTMAAIPAAPTVWQAVAYAQEQAALSYQQPEDMTYADLLEEHLMEWLMANSKSDKTLPGRFHIEFQLLKTATQIALYGPRGGGRDHCEYASLWLILQGQEAHRAMISIPEFFGRVAGEYSLVHEMYPDQDLQDRLLDSDLFVGFEDLLDFDALWDKEMKSRTLIVTENN